jgi:DNA-binding transcriptional ArsR family regulator
MPPSSTQPPTFTYSTDRLTGNRGNVYGPFNQSVEEGRGAVNDDRLSRVFSALADPTRRDIVARLAASDATVNELAEPYAVTVQAVSKHLKVLEDAGLVSRSREAQRRPCHLEAEVFDLMTAWIERYRRQAEERFQRLDTLLDEMAANEDGPPRSSRGRAS